MILKEILNHNVDSMSSYQKSAPKRYSSLSHNAQQRKLTIQACIFFNIVLNYTNYLVLMKDYNCMFNIYNVFQSYKKNPIVLGESKFRDYNAYFLNFIQASHKPYLTYT